MKKRVLISGASVAGPSVAYWLHRYGFETTVVERAPELRPGGSAVDFRGAQVEILRQMGVLDEIKAHETGMGEVTVVDRDGQPLLKMPGEFMSGEVEIMRGDLARVLYDATRENTEYVFGDWITGMTETATGVDVTFARGEDRTFDFVIGADGAHSGVRALLFGPEEQFATHGGCYLAGYSGTNRLGLDRTGVWYNEPGRGVMVTSYGVGFAFTSDVLSYDRQDIEQQKKLVHERFVDVGWKTPELLEDLHDANDLYFAAVGQIHLDRWHHGRVALVGDAAWSAGPGGSGTGTAMLGAYVLAGELATQADHREAFAEFERQLRPSAKIGHGQAKRAGSFLAPGSRSGIWQRNLMCKVMFAGPIGAWFNKMTMRSSDIVKLKKYA
ncbi:FAD-dependent monooxygenase [Amycolatopsis sp. cg5]|uniref:FAD-dependent monooxygenase n=1 Tax=Amycolatopsis sp. cg5 TaxID=3238802 RepID=UPI003524DEF1